MKDKGVDALKKFRKRIKRKAAQIVAVAMSNAYSAWVSEVLPNAAIVYDHFYVIKLMNDRMDNLRRITMNKLADEQKKASIIKYIGYLTWILGLSVVCWILKSQLEEFVIWNCCIQISDKESRGHRAASSC